MNHMISCFVGASIGTLFGILLASLLSSNTDDQHD